MRRRAFLPLLALSLLGGCGRDDGETVDRPRLTVFAAASTTGVLDPLGSAFEGAEVRFSFGPSSALARQIADGAPADLLISASPRWIDFLQERGVLDGPPRIVARNALVAIAPIGSPLAGDPPPDAAALLDRLPDDALVAVADEGVPAGEYARASLRAGGLLEPLAGRLVGQRDVRAVVRAVAAGEVEAGFVYATDAHLEGVVALFACDPATHPPIELVAAVVAGAAHPTAAREFLESLRGEAATALLERAGFVAP